MAWSLSCEGECLPELTAPYTAPQREYRSGAGTRVEHNKMSCKSLSFWFFFFFFSNVVVTK